MDRPLGKITREGDMTIEEARKIIVDSQGVIGNFLKLSGKGR